MPTPNGGLGLLIMPSSTGLTVLKCTNAFDVVLALVVFHVSADNVYMSSFALDSAPTDVVGVGPLETSDVVKLESRLADGDAVGPSVPTRVHSSKYYCRNLFKHASGELHGIMCGVVSVHWS